MAIHGDYYLKLLALDGTGSGSVLLAWFSITCTAYCSQKVIRAGMPVAFLSLGPQVPSASMCQRTPHTLTEIVAQNQPLVGTGGRADRQPLITEKAFSYQMIVKPALQQPKRFERKYISWRRD